MQLYPYQKDSVAFLLRKNGSGYLALDQGLGKTAVALTFLKEVGRKKTLVICPASVKCAWEAEVRKWTKFKPLVLSTKTKLTPELFAEHDIFIVNYDALRKLFKTLNCLRFDQLVADEAQAVKNPSAKRTKLFAALSRTIGPTIFMSGTPVLNRPVELYTALFLLDPKKWPSWYGYTRKFCNGHDTRFGYDTRGASNIEELKRLLVPYFLRYTKAEVLPDLPPKRFISQPVPLDDEQSKAYVESEEAFMELILDDSEENKASTQKLAHLTELRQICSLGKIYAAKDIIDAVVDGGEKIVVFSAFNAPLESLKEKYGSSAVMITGKVNDADRKSAIEKFQNDSSVKVFLGGIVSAGTGITLTASSNVLFLDYDYVPANHTQAADRCHRIGQDADSVAIYQLYAPDTIDDKMREILERKQELINKLIEKGEDTGSATSKSIVREVLNSYKK